ncbi:hypothetical protein REIP_0144 [Rickettsia endosymbiont of Ixodes pacificus]|nr:hypothetical protein REIP_0144 [Rickettsia endosymbiont of Ixodes pacificus]
MPNNLDRKRILDNIVSYNYKKRRDELNKLVKNHIERQKQTPSINALAKKDRQIMGKVRNIFAVNVGRYTKTSPEQRIAFASAKSIWDEATQRLLAA